MAPPPHPPAWYPDPGRPGRIRRWNGRAWTEDVRPLPTWLRTLRLSPGPPVKVPRTSRRLWFASAGLLLAGALVMLLLGGRGATADPDRIADAAFVAAADARCSVTADELAEDRDVEVRTAAWERMVRDLRALPLDDGDTAAVDRWLRAWDRWTALGHDYATALEGGDEAEARRILERSQAPNAAMTRFARVNGINHCVFR